MNDDERFFQKKRILHAVIWILIYVFAVSIGDTLNQEYQVSFVTPLLLIMLGIMLIFLIRKDPTLIDYKKSKQRRTKLEYLLLYVPLGILALLQFLVGINNSLSFNEVMMIILMMIGVGFIEEVLFRGFLLTSIKEKSNQTRAIIISGITFGLGHIVNLSRGYNYEELISQIILAIVIGLALAILFVYTRNPIPGILFHIAFNISGSLTLQSEQQKLILLSLMLLISISYLIYLYFKLMKKDAQSDIRQNNTNKLRGEEL